MRIEVLYKHNETTKNWEQFAPSTAGSEQGPLNLVKDFIIGQIYFPLGSSKEDFKVIIER